MFSGFDGHRLFRYDGAPFDYVGAAVAGAGDVNGDGLDDVVIGAMQFLSGGPGYAVVLSGSDGSLLGKFTGQATADMFGAAVDGAGDVDGDGLSDVIIGAWSEDPNGINSGSARVYSVLTGAILITALGDSAEDEFGAAVAGVGDQDGDGFSEVLIGAPFDDDAGVDAGRAFVYTGPFTGTPGKERIYGVACAGSVGLPRMDFRGDSALNATLQVRLRGALPNTPAAINIGAPTSLPLGAIGAPGCTMYVDPTGGVSLSISTDANGLSRLTATVPNEPLLVGNPLDFQWIVLDPTANGLQVVLSDALVVTFGN